MTTNWQTLATNLNSLHEDGSESGGDSYAISALDNILGDEWIEDTVEYIIAWKKGSELALSCLRFMKSPKAAHYAYKVYKSSSGDRARDAVYLIKHIANPIALDWVEEFLNDNNVIDWGLGVLDQLLWTDQIPYDEKPKSLLVLAEKNSNGQLNDLVNFIRNYIEERNHQ